MSAPVPNRVHYHKQQRALELGYPDGERFELPVELLRVYSPSAEVRGHGPGDEVLQTGKRHVGLLDITQAGRYALKLHFDDGHDTGLYTWAYLYDMARHQEDWWADYLARVERAGASREPSTIQIHQV
ncbi:gamma-butyrobetaine hydroxylase-like domain-containing protein [Salinicola aestuarinus]|uniref:gamma-butyrobetaine hydroxylase-like domain-containing protein n=1 Tax=Salinicola aestuarinus TaxID=1949082 RepID=UPI000DA19038|nr:DUF971 domain-containing protein [Salinicola aestuarinus]